MAILCAVDFSETSALALACAREIADYYAQPLTVVTVADPLLAAAEQMHAGRDATAVLREALAEFVDTRVGSGRAQGQHLQVRIGDAADETVRAAADSHAQLIVAGTQGSIGVEKVMFGSVAERLLRTTTLPILVVPPTFADSSRHVMGSLREVLVPVDFHDHALDDARVAARVAHASHAQLHLLHVMRSDDPGWSLVPSLAAAELDQHPGGPGAEHHDRATAALQRLADALEFSPSPEIDVVDGELAEQVAASAARRRVDLVVMGLRGAADGRSGRVGSMAYRVLCASAVPVLALPAETRGLHVLGFLG